MLTGYLSTGLWGTGCFKCNAQAHYERVRHDVSKTMAVLQRWSSSNWSNARLYNDSPVWYLWWILHEMLPFTCIYTVDGLIHQTPSFANDEIMGVWITLPILQRAGLIHASEVTSLTTHLRIRKQATLWLLMSMARCSNVCRQPPGPVPHMSGSHLWRTWEKYNGSNQVSENAARALWPHLRGVIQKLLNKIKVCALKLSTPLIPLKLSPLFKTVETLNLSLSQLF